MTNPELDLLNDAQKNAVTSEARRILVLAGAGSGKTKTLLQKIIYLIEEKAVSYSNILAVTFTKNAANEMVDRMIISADSTGEYESILLNKKISKQEKDNARSKFSKKYKWIEGLTIKTFHGFCFWALRNFGANEFDNQFKIISDEKREDEDGFSKNTASETTFDVFNKVMIELCDDSNYLLELKKFVIDYIIDKIHIENKYSPDAKDGKFFTTLKRERVRSKSEQYIADWLYRHNIEYEYEPLLNVTDFDFHPDFFIPAANIYIEHVSDKSYGTKNKEEQFKKGKLLLVKTYESMTKDSALFNHTLNKIFKSRLPENYKNSHTLIFKEEFNSYHKDLRDFITIVMRVTDMVKVDNMSIESVFEKSQIDQHERVRAFYILALPIIKRYNDYCINKSYLDFNDLISRMILLLKNHPDVRHKFQEKYKYILVDEFQDVNNLQVELIKLLITDNTQLFCVGDDWQSIYGFRGSNVSYTIEFEKHFVKTKIIKLNLNYRSVQNIVGASNEVIKRNKFKIEKEISASRKSESKIVIFAGGNEDENIGFCVNKITELLAEGLKNDEILFLYRRNKMFSPYLEQFKAAGIKVQAKTIHASKGLEAKAVFIIGLTEGNGGFPDIWYGDRIFQTIKKADHDLLIEEERRLFYVAITRARDKLFLITEKGNESSFLKEIPENFTMKTFVYGKSVINENFKCPNCESQLEKLFVFCPYCGSKQW